jgi:D-cysteine desulfhydrase
MMLAELEAIPRLGWVAEPSAVTPLRELAQRLNVAYLGVKRDDLIGPLFGGTKVRKLDYLLATSRFADAPAWASMGAIGSGQLVATTAAAAELGKKLHAHMFLEPISAGVLDN